jgi:hypothetical protein
VVRLVDDNAIVTAIERSSTESLERAYASVKRRSRQGIGPHFPQRRGRHDQNGVVFACDRGRDESLSHPYVVAEKRAAELVQGTLKTRDGFDLVWA